MNKTFINKLLYKIQHETPNSIVNFIDNNSFDVTEVLEKIAIIPMHYTITIDKKNIDGTICSEDAINLKYFPSMYLAVLNDSNALEMVMFLHKHMATSLRLYLSCYSISYDNEYSKELSSNQRLANIHYHSHAATHGKTKLLNYLLSFEFENGTNDSHELSDILSEHLPDFLSEEKCNQIRETYEQQKLLFEQKDYPGLMQAMESSELVYSILNLIKDQAFVTYCKENGSSFVKLYLENAIYEQGFSDLYGRNFVDNPAANLRSRSRSRLERLAPNNTKTHDSSIQDHSMFNLSRMSYVIGGAAVIGSIAAYCLSKESE
ncbi:MAG: hypothetical protein CMF41_03805 [Legionellales bacterium]|nr:hypothetical protein [Legionellales bacterium]